jgi:hypothetical protein
MFCTQCKSSKPEHARFCDACGSTLLSNSSTAAPAVGFTNPWGIGSPKTHGDAREISHIPVSLTAILRKEGTPTYEKPSRWAQMPPVVERPLVVAVRLLDADGHVIICSGTLRHKMKWGPKVDDYEGTRFASMANKLSYKFKIDDSSFTSSGEYELRYPRIHAPIGFKPGVEYDYGTVTSFDVELYFKDNAGGKEIYYFWQQAMDLTR